MPQLCSSLPDSITLDSYDDDDICSVYVCYKIKWEIVMMMMMVRIMVLSSDALFPNYIGCKNGKKVRRQSYN